jgi:hypothetical protein
MADEATVFFIKIENQFIYYQGANVTKKSTAVI